MKNATNSKAAGQCVRAIREYLSVHDQIGAALTGAAKDDAALEIARIVLPFQQPAASAEPVHQVFHSNGTWEDVDGASRANCEDNGKEVRTLYAAPVAAQAQLSGNSGELQHALAEARNALLLAAMSHGVVLMTDPQQEAWKTRDVDRVIARALDKINAAIAAMGVES